MYKYFVLKIRAVWTSHLDKKSPIVGLISIACYVVRSALASLPFSNGRREKRRLHVYVGGGKETRFLYPTHPSLAVILG